MSSAIAAVFRQGVETGDFDSVVTLLAPDVVFHSPIVYADYHGRDQVVPILQAVSVVFEDFRYIGEYSAEDGHVLEFAARVGDRALDGVDILRFADGQITEFTVMVRPYSAATALRERMAAMLAN
jgi:ketosteroid isomerase-like protein